MTDIPTPYKKEMETPHHEPLNDEEAVAQMETPIDNKIEDKNLEEQHDQHGEEFGNAEKSLTPDVPTKMGEPLPKSQFSMWILDSQQISENQKIYQSQLANAYIEPQVGILLFATALSTWILIKHGFAGSKDNYEFVETKFKERELNCQQLGAQIAESGKFTGDMSSYYKFLGEMNELWANIMMVKAALGLSIRFKKKDISMEILERYKRNPTKAIEEGED